MSRSAAFRVVHVAEDISAIAGGVPAVVRQLSEKLARLAVPVQIAHATGAPGEMPAGVDVFTFPPGGLRRAWSWGLGLQKGVAQLARHPAGGTRPVFHVHGIWAAPQYFAARAAHAAEVPFIVTAHGMLEPWLWSEQGWPIRIKKEGYWRALGYPALRRASVVHAITPLERDHLWRLFPRNRLEVIPNAIELDGEPNCSRRVRDKTILFLGRIEPKKGVDVLLRAFARAKIDKEWRIQIVGPAWSDAYLTQLKAIVEEFGLGKRVEFHGPLFGEEKHKLLDSAWVMAVPSHSEVVGLVNLEAASRYLPTITTHQTGLYDWESGGGLLAEPNDVSIRRALEAACSWGDREQHDRGDASRRLVLQRYSWEAVLPMWMQLYSSLCFGEQFDR